MAQDHVLVLRQEELQRHQNDTLAKVLSFLGLQAPTFPPPLLSPGAVDTRLAELYPVFARTTGWRAAGDYPSLSQGARNALSAFFAPYNAALYEYLGVDLGWDGGRPPEVPAGIPESGFRV